MAGPFGQRFQSGGINVVDFESVPTRTPQATWGLLLAGLAALGLRRARG